MVDLAELIAAKYPLAKIGPWAQGEGHVVLASVDGVSSIVAWDSDTLGKMPDVSVLMSDAVALQNAENAVALREKRQEAFAAYRVAAAQRRLDFLRGYESYLSGGSEPKYGSQPMSTLSEIDMDNMALSMPIDLTAAIAAMIAEGAK